MRKKQGKINSERLQKGGLVIVDPKLELIFGGHYSLHLPLCTTSSTAEIHVFSLQYTPRGFSYHMTLNLALNSGCDRWRVQKSCMTSPSFHSLVFHPPGYHAGSKSTQYCSEECCVNSI